MGFWGWNRVGVNVLGDFSSDVDVAVVADGVSVFHIKQPRFVSNDFLALRWKTNTRKKREERIHVRHFQDKLP